MSATAGGRDELTPETLDQLAITDIPDTVKVVNLVRLLHDLVANEHDTKQRTGEMLGLIP